MLIKNRQVKSRRGFSLLEVMISIGVASIGLLGVLSIVPLAIEQVSRGLLKDRKTVAGKNWVSTFRTRGMANPDNWLNPNGTAYPYDAANPPEALLIDPRFAATNSTVATFPNLVTPPAASFRMPRISLRSSPGSAATMSLLQADEVFRAHDDLSFIKLTGDADSGRPKQKYFGVDKKRMSDGRLSWMGMLASKFGSASDIYLLSVVVFNDRDLRLQKEDPDDSSKTISTETERLSQVAAAADFYSNGVGGGDLKITAFGTGTAGDINVRKGDWVMLTGGTGTQITTYKWYRVIATNEIEATTPPSRDITLQGPDWDTSNFSTPQVVFVPNVITVYEKTVRLENSSLWTN